MKVSNVEGCITAPEEGDTCEVHGSPSTGVDEPEGSDVMSQLGRSSMDAAKPNKLPGKMEWGSWAGSPGDWALLAIVLFGLTPGVTFKYLDSQSPS